MNPLRLVLLLLPLHAAAQIPPIAATLPANGAGTILGRHVFSSAKEDSGLLVDVLVDANGTPRAGIVDVGGFMGVGTKRIAIAWNLLHFTLENGETRIVEALSHDEAAAAPEFLAPAAPVIVTGHAPPPQK